MARCGEAPRPRSPRNDHGADDREEARREFAALVRDAIRKGVVGETWRPGRCRWVNGQQQSSWIWLSQAQLYLISHREKARSIMKRFLLGIAAAGMLITSGAARAAESVTVQLKWVADAQFAGYFVAEDKGFYKEVGLDVTVKPGGPDIAPEQVLASGDADVIVDWMPAALGVREKGIPLVNISQTFQRSGLELTCLKSTGITSPAQFPGHTLGVWFEGNEYPFLAWMAKLDIETDGGPEGVTVLRQGFNVDPLLKKQASCISTMSYNEYWQVIEPAAPSLRLDR
jgi:NMT1/THI5 like